LSSIILTQSVPVVVVQASQPNSPVCVDCSSPLEGLTALHVCPRCLHPQPLKKEESYFEALGVPQRFCQDPIQLEKRFYEVSRTLHPDRFTHAGSEILQRSIQRMSFLNEAYRVLKSSAARRDYMLQLEGVQGSGSSTGSSSQPSKLPMELAEAWFEIQDLMFEDQVAAQQKLGEFERELQTLKSSLDQRVEVLEKSYDAKADQGVYDQTLLLELQEELRRENYLKSMQRDVDRIKKNAHSN